MEGIVDKTIIITGASSGIGEATARSLHRAGANLVLAARRADRLRDLAGQLGEARVAWRATDVTRREDLQAVAALALDRFGKIDVLINNAGIMPLSPIASGAVEDWDRMIDVNIKGVLYGINAVLGHMLERQQGHIVNVASVAAFTVSPTVAVYAATKAAVRSIGDGLRKEHIGKVRVTTIYPGQTESELAEGITDAGAAQLRKYILENPDKLPAEAIAEAIAYALRQPNSVAVNDITVRPVCEG